MPRLLITVMLVLLSGTVAVVAQERAGVQLRILSFGRITGPEELLLVDPKEPVDGSEVRLHLNNFTGPYRAKSRTLVLVDPAGLGGDKPAEPVAKIVLPPALGSRVLLVLVPEASPAGHYLAIPLRDDLAGFGPGQRRFINLTPYPIGGEFDGRRSLIKPNTVTPLKIPPPPDGRENHEVVFYYQLDEEWKPLSSSVWPHDPEIRSLVFFYWNPEQKRIRIQSIAEMPAAEEGNGGGGS